MAFPVFPGTFLVALRKQDGIAAREPSLEHLGARI